MWVDFTGQGMAAASSATTAEIKERIKRLTDHCKLYRGSDARRSYIQLANTIIPFIITCAIMIGAVYAGHIWLSALLSLPAAGLLVRIFIIQHDCGHGSFFKTRKANDTLGRLLSIFTVTPYQFWQRSHNIHHAGSGNLHRRGIGSIDTLTVTEYKALPLSKRVLYRLYRNPFLLLVIGTPVYVILVQRFPPMDSSYLADAQRAAGPSDGWRSILALDAAMIIFYGGIAMFAGWHSVLIAYLPVLILSAIIGGWLFYIQHQFEDAYWEENSNWDFHEASLLGSSYYVLPKTLQWFTGNIGLHHIHHVCAQIPNYRLQDCLDKSPELQQMNRMTIRQSLDCIGWALWDESKRKMIGFRDLKSA